MFRPDEWEPWSPSVQHLPLGDYANAPVVTLDWIDYQWAIRWRWTFCTSKQGPSRKLKLYARRNTGGALSNGVKLAQSWLWLHKAICERQHGPPPTLFHTIADHINGQSLDCRRENLRWVTPAENRMNIVR